MWWPDDPLPAGDLSCRSATIASVVIISEPTDAACCNADRTTSVGQGDLAVRHHAFLDRHARRDELSDQVALNFASRRWRGFVAKGRSGRKVIDHTLPVAPIWSEA